MLEVEQSSELCTLRSGNLELRLRYRRDRWSHELAVRRAAGWQILLCSVEGAPEDAVPPSPAFQELRLEAIGSETYEFQLFGQAGNGIYSAAVRFDGTLANISFDIAARANRTGAALCDRTTYEIDPIVEISNRDGGLIYAVSGEAAGVLLDSRCQIDIAGPASPMNGTELSRRVMIRQLVAEHSDALRTARNARWKYQFRLAPLP